MLRQNNYTFLAAVGMGARCIRLQRALAVIIGIGALVWVAGAGVKETSQDSPTRNGLAGAERESTAEVAFSASGCAADIAPPGGDGVVDVTDLLALLEAWGPVSDGGHPADFNGDGVVDVTDLLFLLGQWGPCATGACCAWLWCHEDMTAEQCSDADGQYWGDGTSCLDCMGSCEGLCSTGSMGCSCDESCCIFGDCCPDKTAACGGCDWPPPG